MTRFPTAIRNSNGNGRGATYVSRRRGGPMWPPAPCSRFLFPVPYPCISLRSAIALRGNRVVMLRTPARRNAATASSASIVQQE